jgi:hypothetical protein
VIKRTGIDSVKRERSESVGNKRVAENGEMSVVPKPTVSLHIYGCLSYRRIM